MTEPVTLAEAKRYLRWIGTGDATLDASEEADIEALITAGRQMAELWTERSIPAQVLQLRIRCFPCREFIQLPRSPVRTIDSITYVDADGDTQTWAAENYVLSREHEPVRLYRAYDVDWPDTRDQPNAIVITYSAGYSTSAAVPCTLKTAIKWFVTYWFEQRQHVNIGNTVNKLPDHLDAILMSWKIYRTYTEREESIGISGEPATTATGGYYYIPSITAQTGGGATALDGLDSTSYPNGTIILTYIDTVRAEWITQDRDGESEGNGIVIFDDDTTRILLRIS